MNTIVEILMNRDHISQDEAEKLVNETRDEIMMLDNPSKASDILLEYLGLESDYLIELF